MDQFSYEIAVYCTDDPTLAILYDEAARVAERSERLLCITTDGAIFYFSKPQAALHFIMLCAARDIAMKLRKWQKANRLGGHPSLIWGKVLKCAVPRVTLLRAKRRLRNGKEKKNIAALSLLPMDYIRYLLTERPLLPYAPGTQKNDARRVTRRSTSNGRSTSERRSRTISNSEQ